jgi:hypothetical protein
VGAAARRPLFGAGVAAAEHPCDRLKRCSASSAGLKGATGTKEDQGSERGAVTRSVPAVTWQGQARTVFKS